MRETYTLKEIEKKLEHEKYLRKENQELYEEFELTCDPKELLEILDKGE